MFSKLSAQGKLSLSWTSGFTKVAHKSAFSMFLYFSLQMEVFQRLFHRTAVGIIIKLLYCSVEMLHQLFPKLAPDTF